MTENKSDEKRFVGTHLEQADYENLKTLADKESRPVSNLVRVCLQEYIEKQTTVSPR